MGYDTPLLTDALRKLAEMGQSVTLNWGEDDGTWECCWISSGMRFVGRSPDPVKAVLKVRQLANIRIP